MNDEALIRDVYAEHSSNLFGYVFRMTNGDRQWAEDVLQETFLRAWRNPESLQREARLVKAWLFTVAKRVVIDMTRSRSSRPRAVESVSDDALVTADPSDHSVMSVLMAEALVSLSDEHREILELTYFADRTVAQAAQELGVPLGTAKSRSFYALRALRQALCELGVTSMTDVVDEPARST